MVSSYHFGVETIAPALGCVLTIGRSLIPLRDVISVRKERRLGVRSPDFRCLACTLAHTFNLKPCSWQELNPTPFAAMILNHTGWVVYAVLHTGVLCCTQNANLQSKLA